VDSHGKIFPWAGKLKIAKDNSRPQISLAHYGEFLRARLQGETIMPRKEQRAADTRKSCKMKIALRKDHEPPAVAARGWRYHHMGIPTDKPRAGERHLKHLKLYVSGFETSPYGIEWMRFEPDCPVSELVRTTPHIAFEVDDLDAEIKGKELLGGVSEPSEGVRVAMIAVDGVPVELLEFSKTPPTDNPTARGRLLSEKLREGPPLRRR
jgi:hypothetical protein